MASHAARSSVSMACAAASAAARMAGASPRLGSAAAAATRRIAAPRWTAVGRAAPMRADQSVELLEQGLPGDVPGRHEARDQRIGARDADGVGTPHGEAADGIDRRIHGGQSLVDQLARQLPLVDDDRRATVPAHGRDGWAGRRTDGGRCWLTCSDRGPEGTRGPRRGAREAPSRLASPTSGRDQGTGLSVAGSRPAHAQRRVARHRPGTLHTAHAHRSPVHQALDATGPVGHLSSAAQARTGNVPMPAIRGGAALKQKPVVGSWSRPVRCSQMGMPAASSALCAGRSPLLMSSMLSESMPTRVAPDPARRSAGRGCQERMAGQVRGSTEVARPAGQHQHRTAIQRVRQERLRADRPLAGAPDIHHDSLQIDEVVERDLGQVAPIRIPVRRGVDVRACVGDQADATDLELRAGGVDGPAGRERQVILMTGPGRPG